jgi:hypothetical protein
MIVVSVLKNKRTNKQTNATGNRGSSVFSNRRHQHTALALKPLVDSASVDSFMSVFCSVFTTTLLSTHCNQPFSQPAWGGRAARGQRAHDTVAKSSKYEARCRVPKQVKGHKQAEGMPLLARQPACPGCARDTHRQTSPTVHSAHQIDKPSPRAHASLQTRNTSAGAPRRRN